MPQQITTDLFNSLPHVGNVKTGDRILYKNGIFRKPSAGFKDYQESYLLIQVVDKGKLPDTYKVKVLESYGKSSIYKGSVMEFPLRNLKIHGRFARGYMAQGGKVHETGNLVQHGNNGGLLVGNRHSEGGIKINVKNGAPIEAEGGEVIITRDAVSDPSLHEFNGKMMTNMQILSEINESGGGVAFAEKGMIVPDKLVCRCSDKEYKYGGKLMKSKDIATRIQRGYGNKSELEKGISTEREEHYDTLRRLSLGEITVDQALKEIALEHLTKDPTYYEHYK